MEHCDIVGMMFNICTTILRPTNVNLSNPEDRRAEDVSLAGRR